MKVAEATMEKYYVNFFLISFSLIFMFGCGIPFFATATPTPTADTIKYSQEDIQSFQEITSLGEAIINDSMLSPDGNSLALATSTGVWVYSPFNFELIRYIPSPVSQDKISWSPNNRWLAASGDGTTIVWDTNNWSEIKRFSTKNVFILSWSPDSSKLATIDSQTYIHVWESTSWEVIDKFQQSSSGPKDINWSSDSSWFTVTGGSQVSKLINDEWIVIRDPGRLDSKLLSTGSR